MFVLATGRARYSVRWAAAAEVQAFPSQAVECQAWEEWEGEWMWMMISVRASQVVSQVLEEEGREELERSLQMQSRKRQKSPSLLRAH